MKTLCVGDQTGITDVACPKCDTPMERIDDGYTERLVHGVYDQIENGYHWQCPNCGMEMAEDE